MLTQADERKLEELQNQLLDAAIRIDEIKIASNRRKEMEVQHNHNQNGYVKELIEGRAYYPCYSTHHTVFFGQSVIDKILECQKMTGFSKKKIKGISWAIAKKMHEEGEITDEMIFARKDRTKPEKAFWPPVGRYSDETSERRYQEKCRDLTVKVDGTYKSVKVDQSAVCRTFVDIGVTILLEYLKRQHKSN